MAKVAPIDSIYDEPGMTICNFHDTDLLTSQDPEMLSVFSL